MLQIFTFLESTTGRILNVMLWLYFAKIKHQVKCRFEFVELRSLGSADFNQIDNILVLEQLQDPDFSQGRDRELSSRTRTSIN